MMPYLHCLAELSSGLGLDFNADDDCVRRHGRRRRLMLLNGRLGGRPVDSISLDHRLAHDAVLCLEVAPGLEVRLRAVECHRLTVIDVDLVEDVLVRVRLVLDHVESVAPWLGPGPGRINTDRL